MSEQSDDAIESLLRKQFDGPVRDGGFSEKVMQRLPPHRHRAAWPLGAGVMAGIAACWVGLLHAPLLYMGWRDWITGEWSIPAITVLLTIAGMSLVAAWWSITETTNG